MDEPGGWSGWRSRFGLAVCLAGLAAGAALVVIALQPAWTPRVAGDTPALVPPDAWIAGLALLAIVAAPRLRRRSEDGAYLLLVLASIAGGLAAHGVAVAMPAATASGANVPGATFAGAFVPYLVAYAGLFVLSAAIVTLWASAPGRSVGRWVVPVGVIVVGATLVGATVRAWGWQVTGTGAVPDASTAPAGVDLSVAWRSGFPVAFLGLAGGVGALRAAGRRHLAAGRPVPAGPATGSSPVPFEIVAAIAAVAWVTGIAAPPSSPTTAAPDGLVPLLWLLVGLVALRWSRGVAWAALALSLCTAAATWLAPVLPLPAPASAGARLPGWIALVAATVAGWQALRSVVPGRASSTAAWAVPLAIAVAPALAMLTGGALAWVVVAPEPGWPIPGLWTPVVVFAPIAAAAAVALLARLVPAVAEAEAQAGDPFLPSRYVGVVTSELVTRQAQVRATAAEDERRRLASDLHAEVLPALAEAAAVSAAGAPADQLAGRLREVEADVRDLLAERRMVILEELGLVEALEWLVGRTEDRAGLEVDLAVDPATTDDRPPRAVERGAFRIAQLAVDNVVRHAGAGRMTLEVLVRAGRVRLAIDDDGHGMPMPLADGAPAPGGYGLADMRLQAAQTGGRVAVARSPMGGTRVTFEWPAR